MERLNNRPRKRLGFLTPTQYSSSQALHFKFEPAIFIVSLNAIKFLKNMGIRGTICITRSNG